VISACLDGDKRDTYGSDIDALTDDKRTFFITCRSDFPQEFKEVVSKCLSQKQSYRPSVDELIKYPVFLKKGIETRLLNTISEQFRSVTLTCKLQQLLLSLIIDRVIKPQNILLYKQIFKAFDTKYHGALRKSDLLSKFSKLHGGPVAANQQISRIFDLIDIERTNELNFSDFLTVAMEKSVVLTRKNILTAFQILDMNKKGYITVEDISRCLGGYQLSEADYEKLGKVFQLDSDMKISFEEFGDFLLKK